MVRLRGLSLRRRTPDGEIPVLQDIDLDLVPGRWTALLGANGSGKSSLLKYLAGDDSPLTGSVSLMVQDPDEQIIAGTVAGELTLGHPGLDIAPAAAEFGLQGLEDLDPRLLSAGQKQRLALAVAVTGDPRVLLCDEPTALQDAEQGAWILAWLDRRRRRPDRILVTATCDRREAALADWLVVLASGKILAQGSPAGLLDSPGVTALLGEEDQPAEDSLGVSPPIGMAAGSPILELRDVGCCFRGPRPGFTGVQLAVGPGQRIGLTGPNGCGKSTLLAVCAGLVRPPEGSVVLCGRPLYRKRDIDLDHGAALLAPQFPEYMFSQTTVAREIALDPALAGIDPVRFLADLGLPPDLARNNPHDLSSGQRRRLAVGLTVVSGRPLLLLDEPTAAQDQAGKELILELVRRIPATAAVIIASHDRLFLRRAGCRLLSLGSAGLQGEMGLAGPVPGC